MEKERGLNTNEKWWIDKIKNIISNVRYGKIELSITVKNYSVNTLKLKSEKSFNFNNDN